MTATWGCGTQCGDGPRLTQHRCGAGTRVYVRLQPQHRGRVVGLCGNFDRDAENDLTSQQGVLEPTAELFGNSWRVSLLCPEVDGATARHPCTVRMGVAWGDPRGLVVVGTTAWGKAVGLLVVMVTASHQENPHRATWARKRCSVLTQQLFVPCHDEVPCQRFYDWCIFDACGYALGCSHLGVPEPLPVPVLAIILLRSACSCDSGGDCECLCTAIATYAEECSQRGIHIRWRSQDLCREFSSTAPRLCWGFWDGVRDESGTCVPGWGPGCGVPGVGSELCRLTPGPAKCDFNTLCLRSHAVRWGAGI